MNNQANNVIDLTLMSTGAAYGIANIKEILGIIILCVQIAWFLWKFIYAIIKASKEDNEAGANVAFKNTIEGLEKIKNEVDKEDKHE